MQQSFAELAHLVVVMPITDCPIDSPSNFATSDVTDNRSIIAFQVLSVVPYPVVVLDSGIANTRPGCIPKNARGTVRCR
jgi:hypothetical protein